MLLWNRVELLHQAGVLQRAHNQQQAVWLGGGTRGERAWLAPTVHLWRADGAEDYGAPRGTKRRPGQLQMGRPQPPNTTS